LSFYLFIYFIIHFFTHFICFFFFTFFFVVIRNVICRKLQMLLTGNRLFPLSTNKHCPSSWNLRKPLVETVTSWNCSPAPLILLCPRYNNFHFNLLSFLIYCLVSYVAPTLLILGMFSVRHMLFSVWHWHDTTHSNYI